MVLYKYLNSTVNVTTNTGHTTNINFSNNNSINNTKYSVVKPMMILFISSWPELFKQTQAFLPNVHHNRLILWLCYPASSTSSFNKLNVISFSISITCSILLDFLSTFANHICWILFKVSHSLSCKVIWFSRFSVVSLNKPKILEF